jgi:hypothetical protein
MPPPPDVTVTQVLLAEPNTIQVQFTWSATVTPRLPDPPAGRTRKFWGDRLRLQVVACASADAARSKTARRNFDVRIYLESWYQLLQRFGRGMFWATNGHDINTDKT